MTLKRPAGHLSGRAITLVGCQTPASDRVDRDVVQLKRIPSTIAPHPLLLRRMKARHGCRHDRVRLQRQVGRRRQPFGDQGREPRSPHRLLLELTAQIPRRKNFEIPMRASRALAS